MVGGLWIDISCETDRAALESGRGVGALLEYGRLMRDDNDDESGVYPLEYWIRVLILITEIYK